LATYPHQLEKLQAAGCEKVYQEKLSGRTTARPQLQMCLDFVREGDTLIVTRLDRLARSLQDLIAITETLRTQQVDFQVLDQASETRNVYRHAPLSFAGSDCRV
jgi:DNA invertase Pin-like site-specific DNA recombinase